MIDYQQVIGGTY